MPQNDSDCDQTTLKLHKVALVYHGGVELQLCLPKYLLLTAFACLTYRRWTGIVTDLVCVVDIRLEVLGAALSVPRTHQSQFIEPVPFTA